MTNSPSLFARISRINNRRNLIFWLYAVSFIHLATGIFLTQMSDAPFFEFYHLQIERFFWPEGAPGNARQLQIWWMELMGATLQYLSILMLLLVYLGHTLVRPIIWFGLLVAFLVWVPQDIYVSITTRTYFHLIVNIIATITIVPPLIMLIIIDRKKIKNTQ
ncbi:hypothetical protein [Thorsellia anophelis]|uniref:Uncharacterized protein n=1 Tax=Thorsellia anophelis DSM 18579 TaxID=1123402 RepID=A0A1I0AM28_9GAMM|nr:hypothetical protein [Thorsellia anophelis]SES95434.1 hypothetical protein SAMN02583745_00977 [Thorsellia anophelis DSM 18579]